MLNQSNTEEIKKRINLIPIRFFRKVALGQILVTILFIAVVAFFARNELEKNVISDTKSHLDSIHTYFKKSLENPLNVCEKTFFKKAPYRITLIDEEGTVYCDNKKDHRNFENHKDRIEIIEAFEKGHGTSVRYSETLKMDMIYNANLYKLKEKPYVIRISVPLAGLQEKLRKTDKTMAVIFFPLLVVLSLLTLWGSLKLAFPLKSLMGKLNSMERLTQKDQLDYLLGTDDDWEFLESTLENADKSLKEHTDQIHLENEKLSKVLESISDSIVAINKNNKILFINNRFRKSFIESTFQGNPLGLTLLEVFRSLEVQNIFAKTLETGVDHSLRGIAYKKDKTTYYYDLIISPLKDSQNETIGAVGVFHDVTENKRNAQIREEFVTNVGHEVKTPLTALKGYVQILKGLINGISEEERSYFDKIEKNADRLGTLFNDILNLSVIESQTEIPKEVVEVGPLTNLVISNVKQNYPQKNIRVNTIFEAKDVYAHPVWIEQILTNLTDNAFKYGQKDGEVNINWYLKDNNCVLEVSDNGMGIAEEHLPRLFERFYRVDPSRSRELGGTGLGLAIVKHIVQKHKGKIEVFSKVNEGTKFVISFPKA